MSGLNLGVMGGVKASTGSSSGTMPTTATEAGFGPGYSQASSPGMGAALAPNDPFGVAFWGGVGALVLLLVIRHSLPNS